MPERPAGGAAAKLLGIDYEELAGKRILQLMNVRELQEIAAMGLTFSCTPPPRIPEDEALFGHEIRENRKRIEEIVSSRAVHFCYPGGVYKQKFLPWLSTSR